MIDPSDELQFTLHACGVTIRQGDCFITHESVLRLDDPSIQSGESPILMGWFYRYITRDGRYRGGLELPAQVIGSFKPFSSDAWFGRRYVETVDSHPYAGFPYFSSRPCPPAS